MLYNHKNDKNENINIADLPEYKSIVNRLSLILHKEFSPNILKE